MSFQAGPEGTNSRAFFTFEPSFVLFLRHFGGCPARYQRWATFIYHLLDLGRICVVGRCSRRSCELLVCPRAFVPVGAFFHFGVSFFLPSPLPLLFRSDLLCLSFFFSSDLGRLCVEDWCSFLAGPDWWGRSRSYEERGAQGNSIISRMVGCGLR